MKNTLKANAPTLQRLREAAARVAPNRGTAPREVPKDSAGTLLKKSKLASAEAARLLGRELPST
jgi:hypothetical protein